ncbi:hypothetical protein [Bradyrhizobium iriomotense]|uniref:hypothetical protein n=1 Tax=Bradyrhizobium iriomotense TaxID=441950 RepID=UPI001B8A3621|nr:hypothetical protein [Bradyrhizobium iriomotense]MBR1127919.1 hypothetical protein [Bradyrhizobium iriomotense]
MKVFIERVRCLKPFGSIGHLPAERTFKIQAGQRKLRATENSGGWSGEGIFEDANRTTSPATAGDGDFIPGPDP